MTNQLKFINKSNLKHFKKAKFTMVLDDLFSEYGLKPNEAMVYSRLLDRFSLSVKNIAKFSDGLGVYVKYDQTELGKSINLSKETVHNVMKRLMELNLIWYHQEKKGLANKIYFIPFEIQNLRTDMEVKGSIDYTGEESPMSTSQISTPADKSSGKIPDASSGNYPLEPDLSLEPYLRDIIYKTLLEFSNNISQSFNLVSNRLNTLESFQSQVLNELKCQIISELKSETSQTTNDGMIDTSYNIDKITEYFKEQVCYYDLLHEVSIGDKGLVDDMVLAMATMYGIDKSVKVKGTEYPQAVVQSLLNRFNFSCALDVIKNIKDYACGKPITDTFSFLKSSIINECLVHNFSAEKDFLYEQHQDYAVESYAGECHDNQEIQPNLDALFDNF